MLLWSGFLSLIGAAMLLWRRSPQRKAQAMMKAICCQVSEAVTYQGYDRAGRLSLFLGEDPVIG
ncbi:MAG: hypothetical protein M5R40_02205 [Anaerolineae bacterium]|nr:hypothetical protein [Anaerolineae bacterium]